MLVKAMSRSHTFRTVIYGLEMLLAALGDSIGHSISFQKSTKMIKIAILIVCTDSV